MWVHVCVCHSVNRIWSREPVIHIILRVLLVIFVSSYRWQIIIDDPVALYMIRNIANWLLSVSVSVSVDDQKCFFHTGLVPVYDAGDLSPFVDPDWLPVNSRIERVWKVDIKRDSRGYQWIVPWGQEGWYWLYWNIYILYWYTYIVLIGLVLVNLYSTLWFAISILHS